MVKLNVRTDKWQIVATRQQKELLQNTVFEFRRLVRCLVGVVNTHWSTIGLLDGLSQIPAVEKLIHQTAKNPSPRYKYFNRRFFKFPSYYRRGAIQFAIGQVSSFNTRYREWQSGIRKRQDSNPPRLNADCGTYPPLYKGQCVKFAKDNNSAAIKVFDGLDWMWITVGIEGHRKRHLNPNNVRKSPYLIVNGRSCHLSVPFQIKTPKFKDTESVLSADLGINTTATVSVINFDGTVSHREFIHPGRDIDRRDKRLKRISKKASLTGQLQRGFARGLYRKAGNINREIGQKVSARLVKIAKQYGIKYIVFEHLKGWRPRGGKKRSTLKQRFHNWLHRRIVNLTEMKWSELGGRVVLVNPRGTSSYAYDGSGKLKRNNQNDALARFANSKLYNADLSASYNIGAKGILKLCGGNSPEVGQGKNSCPSPRSRGTLSMLWVVPSIL
ncbi:IS200/IS605 family accessory protein TnpB-related protein [Pleurocapsa sp. PCC 7319]|uniref:IS200/IS605 family accessory protein TnpB-related protein n=1 Tax=Pleurocapsa sp. PCC 7319 TaxID=118161 RepID=UPI000347ABA9|nr:IS200/IS605 family accessory protein TnpB-related protein [Pleurocapsa sp. PCC 7319]